MTDMSLRWDRLRWGGVPGQEPPAPHRWPPAQPPVTPYPTAEEPIGGWLEERMFGERIVLLQGPIGTASANRVAATLLTLDALGTEPVRLHVAAGGGELTAVFALVDAIDAMRAPVHATALGEIGGAAIGVYAAADRRLAYPHARFRLAEPDSSGVNGTADQIAAAAGRYLQSLEDLLVRVATVTGQPRSRIEDDFSAGRIMDAGEAKAYGLVDEIVAAGPHRRG